MCDLRVSPSLFLPDVFSCARIVGELASGASSLWSLTGKTAEGGSVHFIQCLILLFLLLFLSLSPLLCFSFPFY